MKSYLVVLVSVLLVSIACGSDGGGGGGNDGGGNLPDADVNATPTAFRATSLRLLDPHAFVEVFTICLDATDDVAGNPGLNPALATAITMDGDNDGLFDLSLALVFRPLDQALSATPLEIHFPDCTVTPAGCTPAAMGTPPVLSNGNNMSTQCYAPVGGTTSGYSPDVPSVAGPCFITDAYSASLSVQGTTITLTDATIAGTYTGNPATGFTGGVLAGFISEADAAATMLSLPDPIGNVSLASLLPGGAGNCDGNDDRDTHNGVSGWWMYFDLGASEVPWTD